MKRHIAGTLCFAVLALGLAAVAPAQDGRTCSNAGLAGAWGYTETGTVIAPTGPVPAAAVGMYTFDDAGGLSGTQYSSTGGNVAQDVKLGRTPKLAGPSSMAAALSESSIASARRPFSALETALMW